MKQVELFIVEGKSAESNLKKAVDKTIQRVHAIQGKLINVRKHSQAAVLADLECQQLIDVLGCGFNDTLDMQALPYSTVFILMDPDIDGAHSGALLMSFLNQYFQPLIEGGVLSLIKLPKYRVKAPEQQAMYAWSKEELDTLLSAVSQNSLATDQKADVTRFKGVAQFSLPECEQFMLNPKTRQQFLLK